ncbi:hypothetical protein Avbf_17575 [Armadillidium vulgare]|nr:hypothetical protein Avbf_17575 [Armadillidium vulgare]
MQKLLYISNGVQLEIDRVIVVPLEILNRHCRMDEQLFCQSKRLENKSELTNRHTVLTCELNNDDNYISRLSENHRLAFIIILLLLTLC